MKQHDKSLGMPICSEQQEQRTLETLQEMVVMKQQVIERMRRYHLWTVQEERELEQLQHKIERSVVG